MSQDPRARSGATFYSLPGKLWLSRWWDCPLKGPSRMTLCLPTEAMSGGNTSSVPLSECVHHITFTCPRDECHSEACTVITVNPKFKFRQGALTRGMLDQLYGPGWEFQFSCRYRDGDEPPSPPSLLAKNEQGISGELALAVKIGKPSGSPDGRDTCFNIEGSEVDPEGSRPVSISMRPGAVFYGFQEAEDVIGEHYTRVQPEHSTMPSTAAQGETSLPMSTSAVPGLPEDPMMDSDQAAFAIAMHDQDPTGPLKGKGPSAAEQPAPSVWSEGTLSAGAQKDPQAYWKAARERFSSFGLELVPLEGLEQGELKEVRMHDGFEPPASPLLVDGVLEEWDATDRRQHARDLSSRTLQGAYPEVKHVDDPFDPRTGLNSALDLHNPSPTRQIFEEATQSALPPTATTGASQWGTHHQTGGGTTDPLVPGGSTSASRQRKRDKFKQKFEHGCSTL